MNDLESHSHSVSEWSGIPLITDLIANFTIGAPATGDVGETSRTPKKKFKTDQRLPKATKRSSHPSVAATQSSTRGTPPADVNFEVTNPPEISGQVLPTRNAFTFASSKTMDFSYPPPSFRRSGKSRSRPSHFLSHPSSSPRAIQLLSADVLDPVIRSIQPTWTQIQVLKSLSLVNKALNHVVAPFLYKNIRLIGLSQVYDFSLGLRHPLCVVSLEMLLTPDPKQPKWLPPDPNWINNLVSTLYSLERLMSLGIKRCGNSTLAQAITNQSNAPNFLPLLQGLSFGASHQFAALSLGRSIQSCSFTLHIKDNQNYDNLKRLLTIIVSSGEPLRELQVTTNVPANMDRSKVLKLIGECAPGLRRLSVQFQFREGAPLTDFTPDVIAGLMPDLEQLTSLELIDTAMFAKDVYPFVVTATALTEPDGPCPKLQLVNFNGALWKRTPATGPLPMADLTGIMKGEDLDSYQATLLLLPTFLWTPHPARPWGCHWWVNQAHLLKAKGHQQALALLKQWVLQYWNSEDMWATDPVMPPTSYT